MIIKIALEDIKENKFLSAESLGKENIFEPSIDLQKNTFDLYGWDDVFPIGKINYIFISEEGSRFSFRYIPEGVLTEPLLVTNYNYSYEILNCSLAKFDDFYIGYYDVQKGYLSFFHEEDLSNTDGLFLVVTCLQITYTDIIVQKLNTSKHPVFKIKDFYINEKETSYNNNISATLVANIKGSLSDFYGDNSFFMLINLEENGKNITEQVICEVGEPKKLEDNYLIKCNGINGYVISEGNVYLLPYYTIEQLEKPFEIMISKTYKYTMGQKTNSDRQLGYYHFSILLIIGFILLL